MGMNRTDNKPDATSPSDLTPERSAASRHNTVSRQSDFAQKSLSRAERKRPASGLFGRLGDRRSAADRLGSLRAGAADEEAELPGFTIPKPPRKTLGERLNRHGKAKIYRLKGYTSVARINRRQRREDERHRVITIRIVLTLIALLLMVILIWNPFGALKEFFHALGF
jgi:hypothetical protein